MLILFPTWLVVLSKFVDLQWVETVARQRNNKTWIAAAPSDSEPIIMQVCNGMSVTS